MLNEGLDSIPIWGTAIYIQAGQSPLTLQEARQRQAAIYSRRPVLSGPICRATLKVQKKYDADHIVELRALRQFIRKQLGIKEGFWKRLWFYLFRLNKRI